MATCSPEIVCHERATNGRRCACEPGAAFGRNQSLFAQRRGGAEESKIDPILSWGRLLFA
jgi:hypothetical protein